MATIPFSRNDSSALCVVLRCAQLPRWQLPSVENPLAGQLDSTLRPPEIAMQCVKTRENDQRAVHLLSLITEKQPQGILQRMWDPNEFRSAYGLKSLSRFHEGKPYEFAGQAVRF